MKTSEVDVLTALAELVKKPAKDDDYVRALAKEVRDLLEGTRIRLTQKQWGIVKL